MLDLETQLYEIEEKIEYQNETLDLLQLEMDLVNRERTRLVYEREEIVRQIKGEDEKDSLFI